MHDPYWKEAAAVLSASKEYLRLPGPVRAQLIQDIRTLLRASVFLPLPDAKELADLGCVPLIQDDEDS